MNKIEKQKELKTLKDIEIHDWSECGFSVRIKAEAVKWVKTHSDNFPRPLEKDWTKEWIKHFFNLTEEDLK